MVNKPKNTMKSQPTMQPAKPEVSVASNIKTPTKPKSPSRPSRLKSPARTKSPARLRTSPRTKSPARAKSPVKAKTPSRQSPARKSPSRKSPSRNKKDISPPPLLSSTPKPSSPQPRSPIRRSPGRKSPTRLTKPISMDNFVFEKIQRSTRRNNLDIDSDSDNAEIGLSKEKPQATVRARTRRMEVQVERMEIKESRSGASTFNAIKSASSRSSQNPEEERIVHLKHFDKLGEFSDEDDTIHVRKSVSVDRGNEFTQIIDYGGSLGALFLMVTVPLSIILLHVFCNEYKCSFLHVPDIGKYLLLSTYFDLTSFLVVIIFTTVLALLSVIPFGGKKVVGMPDKHGKFIYVMNGLFCFVVMSAIAIGLEINDVPVTDFILDHRFHLLISSILFSFGLVIFAYIRSFYVPYSSLNIHVVGRSGIYSFFMGREVNPRVLNILDLKMFVSRLTLIGALLYDFAYLYKDLGWNPRSQGIFDLKALDVNLTLLLLVFTHSVYLLDRLIYESVFITSFEIQYEGFGYVSGIGYYIYPFITSANTKYMLDYDIRFPAWKLTLIMVVFLFGFLLYRGSNNQKDAFRKNPYDPALAYLETIPTTKGKKIICSGFWGVVRHPNYLGDILIQLVHGCFALGTPPMAYHIMIVIFLIYRSIRDNKRCKQKYGAAWDRYCSKVKYILIPKVF